MIWKTCRQTLNLSHRGFVMGILNATPDSFSDGGRYDTTTPALDYALQMVEDGADIIDIGGESTRPGASAIDADEERSRVIPVISALRMESDVLISIDTSKASVAAAALEAGADIVNDVTGLTGPESGAAMSQVCAQWGAGVVVMHMLGSPRTMQAHPDYETDGGVVASVQAFFEARIATLSAEGIDPDCLCFDPGIGFGKTLDHNLALIRRLGAMQESIQPRRPILLGLSRKSFLGTLTGELNPLKRDNATAVGTALAYRNGIRLHRVHNVSANVQAIQLAAAIGSSA